MRALLDRTPGWPTLAAAAALVAFMLISAVAPLASAVVAGLSRAQRITPLLALLTAALIAAGTVAVVVRLARLTRPVSADQLGLCGPRSAVRALVFALAAGAALAVLTALWSFVADVRGALPVPPELDPRSAVARAYGLGLSEPVAFGPGLV
ncbi:MAG: hypothetical protein QOE28_3203, partial [Solirubrobacteraceae bacterium]|nr:hypothetical protein [Solirubrobacteraceae bacterium]